MAFSRGCGRLGGSALAQCYGQIGDESPDLDDPDLFSKAFNVTQQLIKGEIIVETRYSICEESLCYHNMYFSMYYWIDVLL